MQYEAQAKNLWQQAVKACSPATDAKLVVQAHKLLRVPGAAAAALHADNPQQGSAPPQATANGTTTVSLPSISTVAAIMHTRSA